MGKKVRYRLLAYMFVFLLMTMGNTAVAQEGNKILPGVEEGSEEERDKLEPHTFQETSLEETREGGNIEEEGTEGKDSQKEAETEEYSGSLPKEQQQKEKESEEDEVPIEEKKIRCLPKKVVESIRRSKKKSSKKRKEKVLPRKEKEILKIKNRRMSPWKILWISQQKKKRPKMALY